jgi:hypothetical protein
MRMMTPMLFLLAAAAPLALLADCGAKVKNPTQEARKASLARAQARQLQQACSSQVTFDRLKQVAFDDAIRIRNADPKNLDTLASYSVVRMENPVVKSRDESLDVTVCSGRFILELPPGAERGFGGERRLTADIEYAAQAAADGSGLVYQIKGAEPIIYKLAAFDLKSQAYRPAPGAEGPQLADASETVAAPPPPPPPRPLPPPMPESPRPLPAPAAARTMPTQPPARMQPPARIVRDQPAPRRAGASSPSFNCGAARTRSERMVCSSDRLAALDRAMASRYFASLGQADGETRARLRQTRDRFLAYRERCDSEGCVAGAYRDRMDEIDDIARGR